jgi:hypothetical protein
MDKHKNYIIESSDDSSSDDCKSKDTNKKNKLFVYKLKIKQVI